MRIVIINSYQHWLNGWATQKSTLQITIEVLQKAGFDVELVEIHSLKELQKILDGIGSNTLVWPNAYWVNNEQEGLDGIIEWVEKYNLPLVGSNSNTLLQLLQKDICQLKLQAEGIPVPSNIIIRKDKKTLVEQDIREGGLDFPVVIKPTKESRSKGVMMAFNIEEAIEKAEQIFKEFPNNNVIIESFLASEDITCGFIRMGNNEMILPSYNVVEGMNCKTEVFSQYHYTLPPEGEKQVCIENKQILNQLRIQVPAIAALFDIQTATRVDGRVDKNGKINFFDVNGFPGLNYPNSALVKQCFSHFSEYDRMYLYECLINSIIGDNLLRYNMYCSPIIDENNLFTLDSRTIIKQESRLSLL